MNITIALPSEIEMEITSPLRQSPDVFRQGGEAWLALLNQSPPGASGRLSISDDSLRRENLYGEQAYLLAVKRLPSNQNLKNTN